jgi:methylenetetrahydrofolate dehydrogenase (NADP+) / methenyltetrahydrofolate cyclohydrolase
LAVCLVGDDAASQVYVKNKEKAAGELGIKSVLKLLPSDTKQADLQKVLKGFNDDKSIHGVLLQLPLPKGLDPEPLLLGINPLKDVDGLHPYNLGMIMAGHPSLIPCTPYGIMRVLQAYQLNPSGLRAVVIGRSRLVGKPIAELLINANATVTIVHSKTPHEQLVQYVRESDLVVAAIGKPEFVKGEWLKEGAIVVDVGINRTEGGKLVGDVEFSEALKKVKAITPVPGGIGPLTVAHLLLNTVRAFEMQTLGYSSIDF